MRNYSNNTCNVPKVLNLKILKHSISQKLQKIHNMQLNFRYIVSDCNTESMSDWNRDISRSFLTQAISLQGTTQFKTNTVLSGIKITLSYIICSTCLKNNAIVFLNY